VHDPVIFAEKNFRHDVWDTPAAIMHAIDRPRARVGVKSCHASSKTFSVAEIVLAGIGVGS